MWKYVLFDLDGTVTDSREGIFRCIRYALEDMGLDIPEEKMLYRFIGPPLKVGFQEIMGMTPEEAEYARDKYRERYNTVGKFEASLYPGIAKVLQYLYDKGYKISLATSKPEGISKQILEHFEVMQYFHNITGDTPQGERGTKQAVIQEALCRLQVPDEEKSKVLMIGDRKYDMMGAKQCGISALGVYFGFAEPGELEEAGADVVLNTVDELLHYFEKDR
ncbi:MAG: HAD-IA family hydrolase [Lachnospiraceae bacterium]|nr:HAD-IA family hydrolase [Lachnospiraceae bacterium]